MEKLTVIIAAYKEEKTIGRCLNSVVEELRSLKTAQYQIIQVCPDKETINAGKAEIKRLGEDKNFQIVKDPRKGKSYALNMALDKAKGDIVVMTDGDVSMEKGALKALLAPFEKKKIGGVTGKPVARNNKKSFMGYLGHILTEAADRKRKNVFSNYKNGYFTKSKAYFPMSGYLLAFRNLGFRYDPKYIDDTFMSLLIVSEGYHLAYAPKAHILVKFPTNLRDYLIQRRRNIHGTRDIHDDKRFKDIGDERTLPKELEYIFFPLKYASNLRELLYSFTLYPLRVITWVYALFPEKGRGYKTWKIVESTKS